MISPDKLLSNLIRSDEGSALVEMTIVFPLFLSLMIGSIDFGRYFADDASIQKSVRDAGRYLASLPSSIFATGCPNWAQQNATDLVVYGKFPVGQTDQALIAAWNPNGPDGSAGNKITISCSPTAISVAANAPYSTLMLTVLFPSAGTLTLSAQHNENVVGD